MAHQKAKIVISPFSAWVFYCSIMGIGITGCGSSTPSSSTPSSSTPSSSTPSSSTPSSSTPGSLFFLSDGVYFGSLYRNTTFNNKKNFTNLQVFTVYWHDPLTTSTDIFANPDHILSFYSDVGVSTNGGKGAFISTSPATVASNTSTARTWNIFEYDQINDTTNQPVQTTTTGTVTSVLSFNAPTVITSTAPGSTFTEETSIPTNASLDMFQIAQFNSFAGINYNKNSTYGFNDLLGTWQTLYYTSLPNYVLTASINFDASGNFTINDGSISAVCGTGTVTPTIPNPIQSLGGVINTTIPLFSSTYASVNPYPSSCNPMYQTSNNVNGFMAIEMNTAPKAPELHFISSAAAGSIVLMGYHD